MFIMFLIECMVIFRFLTLNLFMISCIPIIYLLKRKNFGDVIEVNICTCVLFTANVPWIFFITCSHEPSREDFFFPEFFNMECINNFFIIECLYFVTNSFWFNVRTLIFVLITWETSFPSIRLGWGIFILVLLSRWL